MDVQSLKNDINASISYWQRKQQEIQQTYFDVSSQQEQFQVVIQKTRFLAANKQFVQQFVNLCQQLENDVLDVKGKMESQLNIVRGRTI